MGLLLLSIIASMILACLLWLGIGDQFPPNEEVKLPPLNNIVIYTLLLIVPVYLCIFFVFG
jgi:hypothetical protein